MGSRWCLCIKHADLRAHFFIDLDNSLSGYWCFPSSLTVDFLVALQARSANYCVLKKKKKKRSPSLLVLYEKLLLALS